MLNIMRLFACLAAGLGLVLTGGCPAARADVTLPALIADNIRGFKGRTAVNDQISSTLTDSPELFLYLNNGLTAYCQRLSIPAADEAKVDHKRVNVRGLSIVNGAQTLGTIAALGRERELSGFVFMRIISMERAEDERELARKITYSTNFQNQVHWRDFASLDEQQARIAEHLRLSSVHYHYKDAENVPDADDDNFDFQEALLALACFESASSCDLCSRALSNRRALASPETVYPSSDPYPSRYHRLFSPDKPAEHIWRAVQVLRRVKARMTENCRAAQGQRKQFFIEAKYLVAHILFIRTALHREAELRLTPLEVDKILNETDKISETLWDIYDGDATTNTKAPKTVLSAATTCEYLKGKTLQTLNSRRTPSP